MSQQVESRATAPQPQTIPPIRIDIAVARGADDAFRFFVERFSDWWPVAKHSVSAMREGREPASITLEGRTGGRIFETDNTGAKIPWGHVGTFEPGKRLVLTWHPGTDPAEATEVEFRFVPTGTDSCRVELEHRGWHRLSKDARAARDSYESGWKFVLGELEKGYGSAA